MRFVGVTFSAARKPVYIYGQHMLVDGQRYSGFIAWPTVAEILRHDGGKTYNGPVAA